MTDTWHPHASIPGSHCIPQADQSYLYPPTYVFPRPRYSTGRVTKPRSAGNSPSLTARRKAAMSHSPPMYTQSLQQGYQASFDAALLASAIRRGPRSRPISWHPASVVPADYSNYINTQYFPVFTTSPITMNLCNPSLNTDSVTLGDASMLSSYPSSDIPISNDTFGMQDSTLMQQLNYFQMHSSPGQPVAWDTGASDLSAIAQPMSEGWSFDMMSMNNSMPSIEVAGSSYESVPSSGCLTGPSTPVFLPIQQAEDNSKLLSTLDSAEDSKDELVGMGLYNHPDGSLDGLFSGFPGKGLKLEETFTPSPDDGTEHKNAEEDDDDDDDQNPTEEQVDYDSFDTKQAQSSLDPYKQLFKQAESMLNKSFFFDDDSLDQHTVVNPQQFFNQPCMNYGYGWI